MSRWLSASDRVRLTSQLVAEFENQFSNNQYKSVLAQFGVDTNRGSDYLFHILIEDADDDSIADLGRHFTLDVPEKPEPQPPGDTPLDMSDIDAYSELVSAETALRQIIRIAVPDWIADLDEDAKTGLEAKRAEEDKRRDGIAVSDDLLDYTEIYALQTIIQKHWDAVKPILDDKKRTDVYLSIIFDVRNSIGHSRPVFPSERLLLAGVSGQIRNQLARYRATADGPQRHYPSLDSARDSMGKTARSNPSLRDPSFVDPFAYSETPRLEVGDTVTFELEATDPRGRELAWAAYSVPGDQSPTMTASGDSYHPAIAKMNGNRVSFTWEVTENDVGEDRTVVITVANAGKYHRERKWDDGCLFRYHVNPPPGA